eukprot:5003274-Pyramimonas_sp.AAC.1
MEKEESLTYVDKSKGKIISIKDLLKKEGPEDTAKYVTKCAALGAPRVEFDDMWEGWNVMVMEKSHSEIFARAWRLRQQRLSRQGGSEALSDQPARGAPAVGAAAAATAAAAAGSLPEPK